jgi:hypothetical protein
LELFHKYDMQPCVSTWCNWDCLLNCKELQFTTDIIKNKDNIDIFLKVALNLLVTRQEESNLPPETKLSQREFYSELAIGKIDRILTLHHPLKQIENVKTSHQF